MNSPIKSQRNLMATEEIDSLKAEIDKLMTSVTESKNALKDAEDQRQDLIKMLNQDTILSEAIRNLYTLRGKNKILAAAMKVAEEFKDKTDVVQCIKLLVEAVYGN